MQDGDLDAVLEIESGAYSHPWTKGQMAGSLASGHLCDVAVSSSEPQTVLGYAVVMPGVDERHVLNLTVQRALQRRGLGLWMLKQVLAAARADAVPALLLEVRASNWPALQLYRGAGFIQVGRRHGYYPALRGREDALLMTLALLGPDQPPAHI